MRPRSFFLLIGCMQLTLACYAQVSITKKGITFSRLFKDIREQTGYKFVYNDNMLPEGKLIDVDVKNVPVTVILDKYLEAYMLTYTIREDKVIVISQLKQRDQQQQSAPQRVIRGRITDIKGQPLPGATVVVKGTRLGTSANQTGYFELQVPDDKVILMISFIGYKPVEIAVWSGSKTIQLQPAAVDIKDVTISTGMFNRNKITFSGAVASFTGKELRRVGNLNVLQSLKTLDPSFIISPDNIKGANPNQLPKIEVRGKTSLSSNTVRDQFSTDPNQPLFILNGMETTLQQIVDLDINRVASITLLKDAASTALYGSRAANGVVIVETVQPKPGELNVSYTADLRFEIPDLRDYNMMNAAENLEFQRLAGLYTTPQYGASPIVNDNLYNNRLAAIRSGVNSYWLNVPLQNSFTNGHSLQINGGSSEFQYGIGLNYRGLNGVMIGNDRKTWGGTIDLAYRKNKLNVSNQLYVNGTNANESPYGSFNNFVNINPYYRKKNEDGSLNTDRYLEIFDVQTNNTRPFTRKVGNPIYNAMLGSKNNNSNLILQNTINLIYDISQEWRASGGLQISKNTSTAIQFIPSANTMFENADVYRKGSYVESRQDGMSYQGNLMLTYRKVINTVHSITGNARSEVQEQGQSISGYTATGFPDGVRPNPAFAYGFVPDAKPLYQKTKVRRVNALVSINYAYDNRYFVDLNGRIDGSTSFGAENKYSPFWSVGAGWNISNEKAMKNISWLNMLRIRANIGTTGNQALGTYVSTSVYGYENTQSYFGQGLYMSQLGNPLLEWQRTRSTSGGIDAVFWNGRFAATLNLYEKFSNPLIATGSLPASSGVSSYALNVGGLRTRGAEAILRFSPVFQPDKNIVWTLGYTGSFYKSRYEGFSNILKNLNDSAQKANSLQRFLDGYSPEELWTVTSLGINPATGQEVFRKKNGEKTLAYDPADALPFGDGKPLIQGVISSNLNIKGFLLGINLRYSIGMYIFNTALFNKVENISFESLQNNQDKRAMELRWKQPGDRAEFKGIGFSDATPISSRFIQKENYISGESINAGYEFHSSKYNWLRRLGLKTVRLNAYMNEIFRLSNIRSERGIEYPFSNSVSFSANIFF